MFGPAEPLPDDELLEWAIEDCRNLLGLVESLSERLAPATSHHQKLRVMDKQLGRILEDVDWIDEQQAP